MGWNYFTPASMVLPSAHEQERKYKNILYWYFSFSFYPCKGWKVCTWAIDGTMGEVAIPT
jgi:hypothetical protein